MTKYAREGVPEYWVVDVKGAVIHQMWQPIADRYAHQNEMAFGGMVTAKTIANLTIPTDKL